MPAQKLVDRKSATSDFRATLGSLHLAIGFVLLRTGKPAEAEAEFRKALPISQKLVDDNPTVPNHRFGLSTVLTNLAVTVHSLGLAGEAREFCDRSMVTAERLVQESPTNTIFCDLLAGTLRHRSLARSDLGDAAGAKADARRALSLFNRSASRSSALWFATACCHATLCGLAGRDGAAESAAEKEHEAAEAIRALTRATALGFRNLVEWRTNSALDPLRSREDFRLLTLDVAFPPEPFASTD